MANTITGTLSSAGIGSGLDVNTLVSQLVASERAGPDKILSDKTTAANAQISALGTIKSALSNLQTSMTALSTNGALNQLSAQSADSTVFTATADSSATPGSYGVEVVSLATAAKSASTAYASSSTSVGQGTVTIGLGANSFSVTLASGSDSLANLVSAINNASDNPGVSAAIVNDVNGAHLMLTSQQTGAANTLSVSSALTSGGASFITMNSVTTPADAHIRVDGFDAYSASNSVTTAVSGLTINLAKAQPGTTLLLTTSADQTAITNTIQSFITNYNAALTAIATQTKADPTGGKSGPLVGDSTLRNLVNRIRGQIGSPITGTGSQYTLLSQLGITTNTDGTLKLDANQLASVIKSDPASVQKLFSGTGGIAPTMTATLTGYLQTDGMFDTKTSSLQSQLKDVTKQQDLLNSRMDDEQARYLKQFSALDTLIANMKQTSNYLTMQLANLPGFSNGSNK
jgi:flagellar hook-associated protein 2